MRSRKFLWLAGCAAVFAAAPAWADIRWEFNFSSSTNCLGADPTVSGTCFGSAHTAFGNIRNASLVSGTPTPLPSPLSVQAQAWANTQGGTSGSPASGPLETAYLPAWGGNGLGVQNRDMQNLPSTVVPPLSGQGDGGDGREGNSPEHALDDDQRIEVILFSYASGVKLSGVDIGYRDTDADLFVLAYQGGGAPVLQGSNVNQLTSSGWTLIANLSNLVVGTTKTVTTAVTSNHWLVGTGCYNVTGMSASVNNCGDSKDYVKLLALHTTPGDNRVPEPGTALLLGAAALAFFRARRQVGA